MAPFVIVNGKDTEDDMGDGFLDFMTFDYSVGLIVIDNVRVRVFTCMR